MAINQKIFKAISLVFFILCYFPFNQMIYIIPLFAVGMILFLSAIFCASVQGYRGLCFLMLIHLAMKVASFFFELNHLVNISIFTIILLLYFFVSNRKQLRSFFTLSMRDGWIKYLVIYTIVSCGVLGLWSYFYNNVPPDSLMKNAKLAHVIALGIFFAVMNSMYEELYFRGGLMHALIRISDRYIALIFQALAFAGIHYAVGFPSGYVGCAMTFLYGLFMAHLVLKTGSLVPSFVLHFICDLVVFGLIYF